MILFLINKLEGRMMQKRKKVIKILKYMIWIFKIKVMEYPQNKVLIYKKKNIQNSKTIKNLLMSRIPQQINFISLQTAKNLSNGAEFVIGDNHKRHHTNSLSASPKEKKQNNDDMQAILKKNQFYTSGIIVNKLINDIINDLSKDIQRIEIRKILQNAVLTTNQMTNELYLMQDPQRTLNQKPLQAEKQPQKNCTDPISGFHKQKFIKRNQFFKTHKNSASSHQNSILTVRQSANSTERNKTQRKLPPLMKHLSQHKMNQTHFIPLKEAQYVRKDNKKLTYDMQEIVRERFLKDMENRKQKERIEKMSRENSRMEIGKSANALKKGNSSGFDLNVSSVRVGVSAMKEDFNFDYDGNKIPLSVHKNSKNNAKILKPVCKVQKQLPGDNKPSKLNKKFHEKMTFVPRGSRNCLQINSKTISDFSETNYTSKLKEKLEAQFRRSDLKFVQKQFLQREKSMNIDQQPPKITTIVARMESLGN